MNKNSIKHNIGTEVESDKPLSYESLQQCSADTGIPMAILKAAKLKGFFKHHRCRVTGPLLKWIFTECNGNSDQPPNGMRWPDVLAREKAKREEIRRKKDEGSVIDFTEARRQSGEAEAFYFAEIDRLERELPPLLVGRTGPEISSDLKRSLEELRRASREKFNAVGGKTK